MTNKEKFMEVFGLEPDTLFCPIKSCSNCPYYNNGCNEKNRANFYNLKYTLNKNGLYFVEGGEQKDIINEKW